MLKYKHIIFDLDGTLSDSRKGIINAAIYAYTQMGIKNLPVKEFNEQIGIPLQQYLAIANQFNKEQIELAVTHFRKYYAEKGAFENIVYPGIPELLQTLNKQGKKLYISTAKYEKYARVVADYFKFTPLLVDLAGADAGGYHATKTELTAKIIQNNNITELDKTVVIGDKHMDIEAGHNNGIDSIGVTYGFGTREELENSKPIYIVESVRKLGKILL